MPGRLLTEHPRWSPDGRAILFTTGGTRIYALDLTDGSVRFLAYGQDPEWSPDGRLVAFTRLGREWEIGTIRGDGTGHASFAAVPNGIRSSLVWDAVGSSILFSDGTRRIISLQAQEGVLTPLELPGPSEEFSWSPDGEWLALTAPGPEEGTLALYLYHRREQQTRSIACVWPCRLFWTRKGRVLLALSLDPQGRSIRYDVATGTAQPLRVPEGLVPLAPSPTSDDMLYSEGRAPGDLSVGETGGNRLRVFAHGYLPSWSPDGEWVAFYDSHDEEGSLCTQSRNGANFSRWGGTDPAPPIPERARNFGAWLAVFSLFPGIPGASAALATLPFAGGGLSRAAMLFAAWIALFSLYRPALHWSLRVGHTLDSPRLGHALAILPAALLAALSAQRGFALAALWVVPLLAVWLAVCVYGATAATRRRPGSHRALAAAWAAALIATSISGSVHSHRRSAGQPILHDREVLVRASDDRR